MRQSVTLDLSDDELAFVDEQDIDLDELVGDAIARERRRIARQNPDPTVPDATLANLRAVHKHCVSDDRTTGLTSFQSGGGDRVAVAARPVDDGYQVRVRVNAIEKLPDTTVRDTLAESGPYLAAIGSQLRATLADLTGAEMESFVFDCTNHEVRDFDIGVDKATYETHVTVDA